MSGGLSPALTASSRRRIGMLLVAAGGFGFLASAAWWLTAHTLPIAWIVALSASVLLIGWSTALLLLEPSWKTIAYMTAASVAVPLIVASVANVACGVRCH